MVVVSEVIVSRLESRAAAAVMARDGSAPLERLSLA